MGSVLGPLGALAAAVALTAPERNGVTPDGVARHLRDRYPVADPRPAGRLQFEPGTRVVPLDAPALRRAGPGLRLYRTALSTGHFEYPGVRAAVVAWVETGRPATAECLSADYADPAPAFIGRLKGLRGRTAEDRAALAAEVCGVLAGATPGGRVEAGRLTGGEYRAELWRREVLWRRVRVPFDARGAITGLELLNPSAPKK
jgi:hypothetical protein